METTVPITIDVIGQRTGNPYNGKFLVKMVLTRRENFIADERRRMIVGTNPLGVAPSLNGEAYMLGQLFVRILEGPKWWKDSDGGLDLEDENVIGELYRLIDLKVNESEADLSKEGKQAVEKLTKTARRLSQEPVEKTE
jgi:hypothetical protein